MPIFQRSDAGDVRLPIQSWFVTAPDPPRFFVASVATVSGSTTARHYPPARTANLAWMKLVTALASFSGLTPSIVLDEPAAAADAFADLAGGVAKQQRFVGMAESASWMFGSRHFLVQPDGPPPMCRC